MLLLLSKLVAFLLKPLTWVLILLLCAILGRKAGRKKLALYSSLIILLLFSNSFLFNLVVRGWEIDGADPAKIADSSSVGILLGGYSMLETYAQAGRYQLDERGDRLATALWLYRMGKVRKILLSGGSGRIAGPKISESPKVKAFIRDLGIPAGDIIVEGDSRNTHENAQLSAKMLKQNGLAQRPLLITSAWHMRRALGCFKAQGIDPIPVCSDFMGKRYDNPLAMLLLPSARVFFRWEIILKEIAGYAFYYAFGYI
ncbi:MAG: YdcF family protein [Saprospiraceae bacterium]|nr:YdcF family protein [Saprospiraceae bacterium]